MKLLSILVAALVMGAATAFAQTAGESELKLVTLIFTGNFGLVLGLGVTVLGIWMIIQGKGGGGIFTIILGVLITMLPGVYKGFRGIFCPIAASLGGSCTNFSDGPSG